MLWYVALISVLNLGLGYALAVYLGAANRSGPATVAPLPSWPDDVGATTPQPNAAAGPGPDADVDYVMDYEAGEMSAVTKPQGDHTSDVPPAPTPADLDPVTDLATREYGQQRLAELLAAGANNGWASAVLLEANWAGPEDADARDRLLRGMVGEIRQLIGDGETAARHDDRQILLLLPGHDTDQAAQRAEKLRQRIETTTFVADGTPWPTTLTCALADVRGRAAADELLNLLDEALAEARRYGGNRTFLHDGLSPAPVVPLDLGLSVQQCAI